MASSRNIWESGNWASRRREHAQFAQWYEGKPLQETIKQRDRETGNKIRKFPLGINLVELACDLHRDIARGIPSQDMPLVVRAVVERTQAMRDQASLFEEIINNKVWRASHGGTMQPEILLDLNIHGGTVLKLSWEPWNRDLPYRLAIRHVRNPGFIQPVWDYADPWRPLECYVGYEISPQVARLKYGVPIERDDRPVLYMEHWTRDSWEVTIEKSYGNDVVPVMKTGPLKGENTWGFVPVYYIPHERTTKLFGDSEVNGQPELTKEFNSRAANISDLVRATRPGMLWGHDLSGNLTIREIKMGGSGSIMGYVVDVGRTRNVQGAQAPTLAAIPIPDIPDSIVGFPDALINFWMMIKRLSPSVFGLDDTSSGRITGPATIQRMWSSIAHALTERSYFSEGKSIIDMDILRILEERARAGAFETLDVNIDFPGVDLAEVLIKQIWPPMVPLDRSERHNEWIDKLREGGASIEMFLKEMGVEDIDTAREQILAWMKDRTEAEASAKPQLPFGSNDGTGNNDSSTGNK